MKNKFMLALFCVLMLRISSVKLANVKEIDVNKNLKNNVSLKVKDKSNLKTKNRYLSKLSIDPKEINLYKEKINNDISSQKLVTNNDISNYKSNNNNDISTHKFFSNNDINNYKSSTYNDISNHKDNVNNDISNYKQIPNNDISTYNQITNNDISTYKDNLGNDIKTIKLSNSNSEVGTYLDNKNAEINLSQKNHNLNINTDSFPINNQNSVSTIINLETNNAIKDITALKDNNNLYEINTSISNLNNNKLLTKEISSVNHNKNENLEISTKKVFDKTSSSSNNEINVLKDLNKIQEVSLNPEHKPQPREIKSGKENKRIQEISSFKEEDKLPKDIHIFQENSDKIHEISTAKPDKNSDINVHQNENIDIDRIMDVNTLKGSKKTAAVQTNMINHLDSSKIFYQIPYFSVSTRPKIERNQNFIQNIAKDDSNFLWTKLFSTERDPICRNKNKVLAKIQEKKDNKKSEKIIKGDFSWIKKWGYGSTSYLIDFLNPIFKEDILHDFQKIFKDLQKISNEDNYKIVDVYDIRKLDPTGTITDFKKLNPNYVKEIYDNSLNIVQIDFAINEWGWLKSDEMNSKRFIIDYDINGDGRLNVKELILGLIMNHSSKQVLCHNCLLLLKKKLYAIFDYIDCSKSKYISAEEIWNTLPKINRNGETRWDIFSIDNSDNIRTDAVNDFVIKNGVAKKGFISRNEFVNGILLAYWDRHCTEKEIILDDSRSLIKLRWKDEIKDTIAWEYIKEKELAEKLEEAQLQYERNLIAELKNN